MGAVKAGEVFEQDGRWLVLRATGSTCTSCALVGPPCKEPGAAPLVRECWTQGGNYLDVTDLRAAYLEGVNAGGGLDHVNQETAGRWFGCSATLKRAIS